MKNGIARSAVTAGLAGLLAMGPLPAYASGQTGTGQTGTEQTDTGQTEGTKTGQEGKSGSSSKPEGEPPARPDGEKPDGEPPAKPDGEKPDGEKPAKPDGEKPDGESQAKPDGQGEPPAKPDGAGPGADTMSFDYDGDYSGVLVADGKEEKSSGETKSASEPGQNAALAENGGTLALQGALLQKTGDSDDADASNFYGLNSVLTAVGEKSSVTVSGSEITSDAKGANGIFATDKATVYASETSIETSKDNSRGIDATYGGTVVADGMDIKTQGDHCAGLATDRGGGNVSVTDSDIETSGSGSPIIYSTGDIEVSGVTGTATGSQIAGIEGLNKVLIRDSDLTSEHDEVTASDPMKDAIIVYQSTSGDAEAKTSERATLKVDGSSLTSTITDGAFIYSTNTSADIVLRDTSLGFDGDKADLLYAGGNDSNNWGKSGENGADVRLTLIGEETAGDVESDEISKADVWLTDGTTWTGSSKASGDGDSTVSVSVDGTSSWVVRDSCDVAKLTVADGGRVVDEDGKTVTVKKGDDVVVKGDSDVTVTVADYSTDYDASGAGTIESDVIDRSGFDKEMKTQTSFEFGGAGKSEDAGQPAASGQADDGGSEPEKGFFEGIFDAIADFFRGIFG